MSRPAKPFKEVVREWAKTARRREIEGVCDVLANALAFRSFGVEDDPEDQPAKRGRPPGSRNRPKEQPATETTLPGDQGVTEFVRH